MKQKIYLTEEKGKIRVISEILVELSVVMVFGLFVARFLFFSTETVSKSMEPTIPSGSVVFIDRMSYAFTEPERFDVIGFSRAGNSEDILVRRIIGLPGETVQIDKGVVYINGIPLEVSDYVAEITSDGIANEPIRLEADEFFLLGDKPANSEDSRSTTVGLVKREQILGRAFLSGKSITELQTIH